MFRLRKGICVYLFFVVISTSELSAKVYSSSTSRIASHKQPCEFLRLGQNLDHDGVGPRGLLANTGNIEHWQNYVYVLDVLSGGQVQNEQRSHPLRSQVR